MNFKAFMVSSHLSKQKIIICIYILGFSANETDHLIYLIFMVASVHFGRPFENKTTFGFFS